MKYLLTIITLMTVGVAAYIWANWISESKQAEMIPGTYKLVDWNVRSSLESADSLNIISPAMGDEVSVSIKEDGSLCVAPVNNSNLVNLELASFKWMPLYTSHNAWFGLTHTLESAFYSKKNETDLNSASVYMHRTLIKQTDTGIAMDFADPTYNHVTWKLIFQKQK